MSRTIKPRSRDRDVPMARAVALGARWVAPGYELHAGLVRPVVAGKTVDPTPWHDSPGELYFPLSCPELPGAFAAVDGSEEAVLEFVRRYGLLGFHECVTGAANRGEPISWVLAHARNVKLALEFAHASRDEGEAENALQKITVRYPTGGYHLIHPLALRDRDVPVVSRGLATILQTEIGIPRALLPDPREAALQVVAAIISRNLEGNGIYRRLGTRKLSNKAESRVVLASEFASRSLLDAIYWLLADAVVEARVRRCAYSRCRRFFVATHERMRYCPPLMGEKVSSCGNRDKQRRFADKKRARQLAQHRGVGVREIAENLRRSEDEVREWLREGRRSERPRKGRRPGGPNKKRIAVTLRKTEAE